MQKNQIKKHILVSLKISFAILIVWYLFKSGRLSKESFIRLFKANNIPFIVFSGLIFLGAQLLAVSRIMLLLKTIGYSLRFSHGFKLTMIGNFFNMVIPGAVGGDLVKGFYLFKDEDDSKGRSSGIVIMDRVLGLFALICIGEVSILYLLRNTGTALDHYRNELYAVSAAVGLLFLLSAFFLVFARNPNVRSLFDRLLTALFRRSMFYYMADGLGVLVHNRRILFYTFLLSILIQMLSLTGLLILCNLLPEALPNILALAAVSSVVLLLGTIPVTPGNIGWTELIAAFGWSTIGSDAGAEIFLSWRIITILCSLPGGLIYLFLTQDSKKQVGVKK
jgi:uncharacterized protein (TIRG00374 family)